MEMMATDTDKRSLSIETVMTMMWSRIRSLQVEPISRRRRRLRLCCLLDAYKPTKSMPPTIIEEMEETFLRLSFSKTVAMKLVDDQGTDSPWTLASLSDEYIATFFHVIRMPGKMPNRGHQISVLAGKNLKHAALMFQSMECCSRIYDIKHVNSTSVLQCKHQWELEQKKTNATDAHKVDKNNWAKT